MKLKLLLVTNKEPHHKYWVYELFNNFNVVGIIHPKIQGANGRSLASLKKLGVTWFILKLISSLYQKSSKNSFVNRNKINEQKYFGEYNAKYLQIPSEKIFYTGSVNNPDTIEIARRLAPDVICFLGGDIAKKDFISIPKIGTLNYHSGISPFYNGTATTFQAAANQRPNFCGGTLMIMNEKIDGGDILSHYLTPISIEDDASSLFMKGIIGAVKLYKMFLNHLQDGKEINGIKQQRSVNYYRSNDWTIIQDLRLKQFENKSLIKNYLRDEKIFTYYDKQHNPYERAFPEVLIEILQKKNRGEVSLEPNKQS